MAIGMKQRLHPGQKSGAAGPGRPKKKPTATKAAPNKELENKELEKSKLLGMRSVSGFAVPDYGKLVKIAHAEVPEFKTRGSYARCAVEPLHWKDNFRKMLRILVTSGLSASPPALIVLGSITILGVARAAGATDGGTSKYADFMPFFTAAGLLALLLSISGQAYGLARILHCKEWKALLFALVIDGMAAGAKLLSLTEKGSDMLGVKLGLERDSTYQALGMRWPSFNHMIFDALIAVAAILSFAAYWIHNNMSARKREKVDRMVMQRAAELYKKILEGNGRLDMASISNGAISVVADNVVADKPNDHLNNDHLNDGKSKKSHPLSLPKPSNSLFPEPKESPEEWMPPHEKASTTKKSTAKPSDEKSK